MGKHNGLKTIRLKYFDLCEQRDYCLTHMGHEPGLDAYREFAVKTEETMTEIQSKVAEYGEIVETSKKKARGEDGSDSLAIGYHERHAKSAAGCQTGKPQEGHPITSSRNREF